MHGYAIESSRTILGSYRSSWRGHSAVWDEHRMQAENWQTGKRAAVPSEANTAQAANCRTGKRLPRITGELDYPYLLAEGLERATVPSGTNTKPKQKGLSG
jgi:hypothetical protein